MYLSYIKNVICEVCSLDDNSINILSQITSSCYSGNLRISNLARNFKGNYETNYKKIQRFLDTITIQQLKDILLRISYQENENIVIGDPSDIPRPDAWKTPYVSFLKERH